MSDNVFRFPGILHEVERVNAPGLLARQWPLARRLVMRRAWWAGFLLGGTCGVLCLLAGQLALAAWLLP